MKSIVIAAIGLFYFAFTANDQLTGTWERISTDGRTYKVIFHKDSTFDMHVDGTPRLTGTYKLRDDLLTVDDTGCPDATGTYKITFFSNGDSCKMQMINDACMGRAQQADGPVLGRVKKIKL